MQCFKFISVRSVEINFVILVSV